MTDMEVIYGHTIRTPGHKTFAIVATASIGDPHLFAESLGDRRLGIADSYSRRWLGFRTGHSSYYIKTMSLDPYSDGIIIRPSMAKKKTTV